MVELENGVEGGRVTQVGHRTWNGETGHTFRPEQGAVRRLRLFTFGRYSEDEDGNRKPAPEFDLVKAFRSGARANDPNGMMRGVAAKLSDREIQAVAEYAAGLR